MTETDSSTAAGYFHWSSRSVPAAVICLPDLVPEFSLFVKFINAIILSNRPDIGPGYVYCIGKFPIVRINEFQTHPIIVKSGFTEK
ncbi:MAG: hypothetical protein CME33_07815 [Gimesia sp.]|nr:hypothetical protein [Gimesia sp.]|tara:strand:+ start:22179 stop:22436 length:258 start_codon:yes stop_codon:yes gene_type:complete